MTSLLGARHSVALMLFLPNEVGEVAPSYGVGGVMGVSAVAHDPSARFAGTSPREARGGSATEWRAPSKEP
jgi:hypothetical protein